MYVLHAQKGWFPHYPKVTSLFNLTNNHFLGKEVFKQIHVVGRGTIGFNFYVINLSTMKTFRTL